MKLHSASSDGELKTIFRFFENVWLRFFSCVEPHHCRRHFSNRDFLDTHRVLFRFDGLYREQTRSADDRDNKIEKLDGGYREIGHPIFLCWRHDSAGLV